MAAADGASPLIQEIERIAVKVAFGTGVRRAIGLVPVPENPIPKIDQLLGQADVQRRRLNAYLHEV